MPLLTLLGIVELVLSFIGTGIAGTLYYAYIHNVDLPCSSGGGCSLVEASHWAQLWGYPVAMFGVAGYAALAILGTLKLFSETPRAAAVIRAMMLLMTLCGVGFSWYLQYVAAIDIGAFCIWCRSSAITMTLLFAALLFEYFQIYRANSVPCKSVSES